MNGVAAARFTPAPKGSTVRPIAGFARFGQTEAKFKLCNASHCALQHALLHLKVVACDQVEAIEKCRQ